MADQSGRVVTQLSEAIWLDTQRLYNMGQCTVPETEECCNKISCNIVLTNQKLATGVKSL